MSNLHSVTITAARIAELVQGKVIGNSSIKLTGFAPADSAGTGDLTFAEKEVHFRAAEQSRATGRGGGGAKGGDQGERGPAKHVPGTGPGKRVTSVGPRAASRKAKEEGKIHHALSPHQRRNTFGGVLRAQA